MNIRSLFVLLYFLICSGISNAQIIEKIILKNGSVLEGHIVSQVPNKNIEFYSEISTIVSEEKCISKHGSIDIEKDDLSDNWQQWIKDNKESLFRKDGKCYLKLDDAVIHSQSIRKDSVGDRYLLENQIAGTCKVKFLERYGSTKFVYANSKTFSIPYSSIFEIQKIPMDRNAISGTIDVVETDNNAYEGQIISQKLGESVNVLCDDGCSVVIPSKQIKSQKKSGYNAKQSIFEQVPYIEIVTYDKTKTARGIIVSQTISEKTGNYILVKTAEHEDVPIQNKDIVKIVKEKNPEYKTPMVDILIENDSIYLCRKNVKKISTKEYKDEFVYMEVLKDSVKFSFAMSDLEDGKLVVECYNDEANRNIKIVPVETKEVKVGKTKKLYYACMYADLVKNAVKPSFVSDISPNNTLRMEYELAKGIYALYIQEKNLGGLFEILE